MAWLDWQQEVEGWSHGLKAEAISFLLGAQIGSGIDRKVYVYEGNPEFVVKVEAVGNDRFQNTKEWLTWQAVKEAPELRKWFAPCVRISPGGAFLMMERTSPIIARDAPKRVPAFFTDMKYQNWGRLGDGRVVCHDYGTNLALDRGLSTRLRNADWWT